MGIATGEAELRGADYFGAVLNRAARVMAAGHGGQILLAESAAGLLSGVDLLDLGPRRLRDLPIPVGVFQVRAPGLPTDFPPLRGVDSNPGNLRPAITSLIGREAETAELQDAVKFHRLVTLISTAVPTEHHIVRKQKPSCQRAPTECVGTRCTARSCLALQCRTPPWQQTVWPAIQDHYRNR